MQGRIIELLEPSSTLLKFRNLKQNQKQYYFHPSEAGMLNIGLIWEGLKEAWNAGSERGGRRILPNSLNTNEQPLDMDFCTSGRLGIADRKCYYNTRTDK